MVDDVTINLIILIKILTFLNIYNQTPGQTLKLLGCHSFRKVQTVKLEKENQIHVRIFKPILLVNKIETFLTTFSQSA